MPRYEVSELRIALPRQDAGATQRGLRGPYAVTVRDRQGHRVTWRASLSWNEAQRLAKNARRANYRDVRIRKPRRENATRGGRR